MSKYFEVFQENLGRTNIVEHNIVVGEGASVKWLSPSNVLEADGPHHDYSDFTAAYLNDIVKYCSRWEEHLGHHSVGLTINPLKCVFNAAEKGTWAILLGIWWYGHGSTRSIPFHHVLCHIQGSNSDQFLGMAGFHHCFIPLFSGRAALLRVEGEALAIKWAIDSLCYYLLGREFTLETDHKALQWVWWKGLWTPIEGSPSGTWHCNCSTSAFITSKARTTSQLTTSLAVPSRVLKGEVHDGHSHTGYYPNSHSLTWFNSIIFPSAQVHLLSTTPPQPNI